MDLIQNSMANITQDFQYSIPPIDKKNMFYKMTSELIIRFNNDNCPDTNEYIKEYNGILDKLGWGWKINK
jgi:hypothetical protein